MQAFRKAGSAGFAKIARADGRLETGFGSFGGVFRLFRATRRHARHILALTLSIRILPYETCRSLEGGRD
jgi:phage tail tape-measure protein